MVKTSMGLEENIAGLLCYVLGWITGIVFLVLEKENKFDIHVDTVHQLGNFNVDMDFGANPLVDTNVQSVSGRAV